MLSYTHSPGYFSERPTTQLTIHLNGGAEVVLGYSEKPHMFHPVDYPEKQVHSFTLSKSRLQDLEKLMKAAIEEEKAEKRLVLDGAMYNLTLKWENKKYKWSDFCADEKSHYAIDQLQTYLDKLVDYHVKNH